MDKQTKPLIARWEICHTEDTEDTEDIMIIYNM